MHNNKKETFMYMSEFFCLYSMHMVALTRTIYTKRLNHKKKIHKYYTNQSNKKSNKYIYVHIV